VQLKRLRFVKTYLQIGNRRIFFSSFSWRFYECSISNQKEDILNILQPSLNSQVIFEFFVLLLWLS
jgi:hypothetical protein